MTPEDFEIMNNTLIAQAGELEIVVQQQQERIRDLEAQVERLQAENDQLRKIMPYQRKWE